MSKSLEKEYREFTNQAAPDLWERIESGLADKGATAEKNGLKAENIAAGNGASEGKEFVTTEKGRHSEKRSAGAGKRRARKYQIWGMAAACLCLAVTGFSLRNLLLPGREQAAEGIVGNQMSGIAMNGGAESAYKPAERNDYEAMKDNVDGEVMDGMAVADMDSAIDSMGEPNQILEAPGDWAEAGEPAEEMAGGEYFEANLLEIEIASVIKRENEVVYAAEIRASEDLSLQAGDRITLYDGREGSEALAEGESYEVYACALTENGGETVYRIVGIK